MNLRAALPYLLVLALALALPLLGEDYWAVVATRAASCWVLVTGLNLVAGFAGQLAIGYVALLTLGAYTASVFVPRTELVPALLRTGRREALTLRGIALNFGAVRAIGVPTRLRAAGTAVLLVEQLIEKAIGVADRAYAMAGGRIILAARAGEPGLADRLEHAYLGAGTLA